MTLKVKVNDPHFQYQLRYKSLKNLPDLFHQLPSSRDDTGTSVTHNTRHLHAKPASSASTKIGVQQDCILKPFIDTLRHQKIIILKMTFSNVFAGLWKMRPYDYLVISNLISWMDILSIFL